MRCYHDRRTFIKTSSAGTFGIDISAASLMNTDSAFGAAGKTKVVVVKNAESKYGLGTCNSEKIYITSITM